MNFLLYACRIPWLMIKKYLRPLPKAFVGLEHDCENKMPVMTFPGGLSSCVPSKTVTLPNNFPHFCQFFFNILQIFLWFVINLVQQQIVFETLKSETVASDEWDDSAVNEASKLISSATEVYFKPMAKYKNTIFGEIKLLLTNERELNLTSHMCATDYAMLGDSLIPESEHETFISLHFFLLTINFNLFNQTFLAHSITILHL